MIWKTTSFFGVLTIVMSVIDSVNNEYYILILILILATRVF